ncbi:MAG TPA: PEP-CTERM sorting domain-containing protein [Pirellulales bacterium]|jgi:hypothetical protein|nr:PEP-CTERM sorting domain-containing protein [Pirellulales bacterium]
MKPATTMSMAALVLLVTGQTFAAPLVGVGFQSAPTHWTLVNTLPTTDNNLIDESGHPSGIDGSFTDTGGSLAGFFVSSLDASTVPMHSPSLLALNHNLNGSGVFSAVLSGLTADHSYDIWVFVARQNVGIDQEVTLTGAAINSFDQVAPDHVLMVNSSVGSSSKTLEDYALPIESSAGGSIDISIAGLNGAAVAITGLAIQDAAPEPTSLTLVGIGVAGLAGCGWRRRKQAVV